MSGPGQVGIRGPFEIPYEEGSFVPVPHSLVVVGTAVYGGIFRRVGNVVFYIILVSCGVGETSASTAGVTYFTGLPFWLIHTNFSCHSGTTETDLGFAGTGENFDDGAGGRVYPPTWAPVRRTRTSGWFFVTP